jgi:hypothetical protein
MHEVFLKLENPKNSLFWANIYKKNKKNQKTHKKTKKKPLGWFFLNPGFSQPCPYPPWFSVMTDYHISIIFATPLNP